MMARKPTSGIVKLVRSDLPPPRVKYSGNIGLVREIEKDREFNDLIHKLLKRAKYKGEYSISVNDTARATSHRQGLHMSPQKRGLELQWRGTGKSNDRNIVMLLSTARLEDAMEMQQRFKALLPFIDDDDEEDDAAEEKVVSKKPTDTPAQPIEPLADEVVAKALSGLTKKLTWEERVELLMLELINHKDSEGCVPSSTCTKFIFQVFECKEGEELKTIYDSLIHDQHLMRTSDKYRMKIGKKWRIKAATPGALPPTSTTKPPSAEAEPNREALEPPAPKAQDPQLQIEKPAAAKPTGTLLQQIEELEKQAALADKTAAELQQVQVDREDLEKGLAQLEASAQVIRKQLVAKKAEESRLERELAGVKDASVRVAAIKKLLGL